MTNPVCNFPTIALELQAKDDELQNQITQEISARIDVDNQLQSNIETEANTRSAADQELQNQVSNEAVSRIDADNVLEANINTEIDTRKNADQELQEQINALNIPGTVQYFARQTAPEGWLKADGSAASRAQYANLFDAVGTIFGAGDGITTFNLPDLRGEFIRGVDDGRGVDASRSLGSWQKDQLASHQHTFPAGDILDGGPALQANRISTLTASTTYVGGIETRPRNVALLACVKY